MTTATRRLRRTGVATLAASVAASLALVATAGSAFAALGTIVNKVDPANTATTVYPGQAAQATGGYLLDTTNSFAIGDQIVLKLEGAGIDPSQTNKGVGFATKPALTAGSAVTLAYGTVAAATANGDVVPTFTTALAASNTTAAINDELVVTFTNSSAGVTTDHFTLTLAPASVTVGSAVPAAAPVQVHAYAANGTTSLVAAATIANVANTKASVSAVTAAAASLAVQTVAVGTVTLSDVGTAAVIASPIYLTASAGVFTTGDAPTVTGPTGSTWTVTGQGTAILTLTAAGTAFPTANNTFTISGLTIDVPAGNGAYTILAKFGGVSPGTTTIGAAFTVIAVSAQSRIGGIDRYASSAQLFNSKFALTTIHSVVLASGGNFPDALSATYLAATLGTGVVLTDPNILPQQTSQVLTNGNITTVYIVGGTAAVSASEQTLIASLHTGNAPLGPLLTVLRVAGSDRYATNNAADLFSGAGAGSTTAVVATGTNFADALAAGPAVYAGIGAKPLPLVLTSGTALSASAKSTLTNLGISKVVIVGGTAAVSAAVETSIKALGITISYRIAGADRTLTASMIATWEAATAGLPATSTYGALASLGFLHSATTNAYIARGDGFADALSAGAVAGAGKLVILLTGDPNTLGAGIPAYLGTAGFANVGGLIAVGLTGAVSNATFAAAVASL